MTEHYTPPTDHEEERARAFASVVEQYLPEDHEFIVGMDEEEALGYVYGMLLEMGEDPDVILQEFGVTEETMTVIEVKPQDSTEFGEELRGVEE